MNELFPEEEKPAKSNIIPPLAERIRPKTIDEVIGQEHILGTDAPLRKFFESGSFPSILFWGLQAWARPP
jgi:putative ATPase